MGKARTYRVFTCLPCTRKHAWDVKILPEVGRGQCHFCGKVNSELYETPLLVVETAKKRVPRKES